MNLRLPAGVRLVKQVPQEMFIEVLSRTKNWPTGSKIHYVWLVSKKDDYNVGGYEQADVYIDRRNLCAGMIAGKYQILSYRCEDKAGPFYYWQYTRLHPDWHAGLLKKEVPAQQVKSGVIVW